MPRTATILGLLIALALVVVGAWWIGAPAEIDDGASAAEVVDDPVELAADVELADAPREQAPLADVVEPESATRVAIAPESAATPASDAPPRAGAVVVRGRLLDAATGEPLPDYTFVLEDRAPESARATTDERGEFATWRPLLPGPLRVRYHETSRELVDAGELRVGADGLAEPLVLRVASGPTYRIAVSPSDAPPRTELTIVLVLDGSRASARGRVLAVDPPRARFAPFATDVEVAGRATITATSKDGIWVGSRGVAAGLGVRSGVVEIALKALAALEARVVDPTGAPLSDAVVTWIEGESGEGRDAATNSGLAVFHRVKPGAGTVRVRLARWQDLEVPLVLAPGVVRKEELTLAPAPSAGSIRGLVSSDTGLYDRGTSLRLVPRDDGQGARPLVAKVAWETDAGARIGSFRFDDLPPGRWRLQVVESDWYEWEPRAADVEAPLDGLHLRVHDAVAVCDLRFEPRDDAGASVAAKYEVRIASGGEVRVFPAAGAATVVATFPVDKALRWRVDAPGRAAVFGDWTTLSPLLAVDGREQRGARPVLERGWAQLYRVVRADNKKPAANALALVDGREAGRTDAQGRVELRAATPPKEVTFRFKDWRASERVSVAPTRAGSLEFERTVRLAAPKPKPKKKP